MDISYRGDFHLEHYRFTKMAVGCIIVGLGFGLPTVVYEKDRLPMPIKTIIHMGIGCSVYTITAYAVGWLGGAATLPKGLLIAAVQLSVGFVIWFLFMRHYRKEAKIINERIQEMKQ